MADSVNTNLYTGKGGKAQEVFIRKVRRGWVDLKKNTQRHLTEGVSQYEYLQEIGKLMDGQAARLLEEFIDDWDYSNEGGTYYEEVVTREAARDKWRAYYHHRACYNMRCGNSTAPGPPPVRPDQLDDPIVEPNEVEEFLEELLQKFQAS